MKHSYCVIIGPALSGSLVQGIGFENMLVGIAIICFLYGPFLCFLKHVPPRSEQEKQENSVSISYTILNLNSVLAWNNIYIYNNIILKTTVFFYLHYSNWWWMEVVTKRLLNTQISTINYCKSRRINRPKHMTVKWIKNEIFRKTSRYEEFINIIR